MPFQKKLSTRVSSAAVFICFLLSFCVYFSVRVFGEDVSVDFKARVLSAREWGGSGDGRGPFMESVTDPVYSWA